MKKSIFGVCLGAIALSGLLMVSCSTEYTYVDVVADVPTITVSPVTVTVSADEGTYSFNYSVTNAASSATVSCSADVTWLSDFDASVNGIVYFTASENAGDDLRTGNVTITYAYDEGTVTAKAGVIQYGQETPTLSVQPNAVAAAYGGGTYSFSYELTNAGDGEIACTSDQTWVNSFDYSTYGKVSFTVDANEGEELRTATITVAYEYSGASISKEVTVIQDHPGTGDDGGDGGGGGGGDVSDIIGTYTASGQAYYSSGTVTDQTWTMKIYAYTGSDGYDIYIDGLVPQYAGKYDSRGDHAYSALGYYQDGNIVVPTALNGTMLNVTGQTNPWYLGYTPCGGLNSAGTGFSYWSSWPSTTFTYDSSTDTWTSDYGDFAFGMDSGTASPSDKTTWVFSGFFDCTCPGVTIKRTSTSTEAPGANQVNHSTVEHMQESHFDFVAK